MFDFAPPPSNKTLFIQLTSVRIATIVHSNVVQVGFNHVAQYHSYSCYCQLLANWHRAIVGLFGTAKFRSDLNCQIRYMTFCLAVRSDKLTNMAAANVKPSDIPSLNFGPKHLSLRQNQRAMLS